MDILTLAQSRIPGLKKKTAKEWAGSCPECGGTDRFLVWIHRQAWHCRGCNTSGDVIEFLRRFDHMSCPDAHEAAECNCRNNGCVMWGKCRLGARVNSGGFKRIRRVESVNVLESEQQQSFVPDEVNTPHQAWQKQAARLIEKAHTTLLDCPEQLNYLAARGIPRQAVEKGQLGWIPENCYPVRESWGLPIELKPDGKKKKMFIPAGILIPFFDADCNPHRIRIRRSETREKDARYYWLQGSGDDVPVIGGIERRGIVVVESDLDAYMVHWQCRDLDISVIPLGTCNAKPKGLAMSALENAFAILVAHDFEPRVNTKTGKHENPGGQGARWWLDQFSRAERWPVPAGKDPGEFYQDHGGNIREWVLAGLPPVFHVLPVKQQEKKVDNMSTSAPAETSQIPLQIPGHAKGTTLNGYSYAVAYHAVDVDLLEQYYLDRVVFSPAEIEALKGMDTEDAEKMLLVKREFGGVITGTKSLGSIMF